MYHNFSNFPAPENAGEYERYESNYGPMRPSHSQSWHVPHPMHNRGPSGPMPYMRPPRPGELPSYSGPYGGASGFFHRDRRDIHSSPLDLYGDYPSLPGFLVAQAADCTPNASNTGLCLLDQQMQLKPFLDRPQLFTDFNAPAAPRKITMSFDISARRIDINWSPPDLPSHMKYAYNLEVIEGNDVHNFDMPWHKTTHAIKTTPGNTYEILLRCKSLRDDSLLAQEQKTVKAVFSIEEMRRLYTRAVENNGTNMHSFMVLYRCKPQPYWDDIYNNCQGIMEKYLKDNNGQPANSINGVISGLFFSARLLPDGILPYQSPFGNRRLRIPAPILLSPTRHVMYFADYYCNYITHYVTVVICRKNSDTDRYCSPRLIRMNPEKNPFLRIEYHPPSRQHPDGGHVYWVNKNVWVEILYTENININMMNLDHIEATGAGTSRIGGLPNNKQCEQCNLYPLRSDNVMAEKTEAEILTSAYDFNESTFHLCNSLHSIKAELGDHWADAVETVCHLVNGACEMAESDLDAGDPQHRSMERMNRAMTEMEEELVQCQDIEVLAIADDLRSMVQVFKEQRQAIAQLIEEGFAAGRLLAANQHKALPSAPLAPFNLPVNQKCVAAASS